ncbi:MAG: hypothetical protein ABIL62_12365 [Planctomycetota bacterium]
MKFLSIYEIKARYVPAIIAALPIIILSGFVKEEIWISMFHNARWFLFVENFSMSVIAVLLLIHVQRGIAKHLFEEKIFDSGKNFPASRMLLFSDDYLSEMMKVKVREKIKKDFAITLCTQSEEQENLDEAKKSLRDAVALVRKQVGDGDKTLQYNIHYGFSRNLIGGSVLAVPYALFCAIYAGFQGIKPVCIASSFMLFFFVAVLFLSKSIMVHYGNTYAECLLTEFLTTNIGENI